MMALRATSMVAHTPAFYTTAEGQVAFNPFLASIGQLPANTQVLIQPTYSYTTQLQSQPQSQNTGSSSGTVSFSASEETKAAAPRLQKQISTESADTSTFYSQYNPLLQPAQASVQEAASKLNTSILDQCPDSPAQNSETTPVSDDCIEMDLLNHCFEFDEDLFAPLSEETLPSPAECCV